MCAFILKRGQAGDGWERQGREETKSFVSNLQRLLRGLSGRLTTTCHLALSPRGQKSSTGLPGSCQRFRMSGRNLKVGEGRLYYRDLAMGPSLVIANPTAQRSEASV